MKLPIHSLALVAQKSKPMDSGKRGFGCWGGWGTAEYTLLTRGVSHCGLAIYIKKHLKAKEELWKLKYFTMQKYNLQKIL